MSNSDKKDVKELTANYAEGLKKEVHQEIANFRKNHLSKSRDVLAIVLKSHLFIEKTTEDILTYSLEYPNKSIDDRKSFSYKVNLLEALGYDRKNMISRLRAINDIRNEYAHNLEYKISKEDIKPLVKNLSINNKSLVSQLVMGIMATIGYLMAVRQMTKSMPFITYCLNNWDRLEQDPMFSCDELLSPKKKKILAEFLASMEISSSK